MISYSKWIVLVVCCAGLPARADFCGYTTTPEQFQSHLKWVSVLPAPEPTEAQQDEANQATSAAQVTRKDHGTTNDRQRARSTKDVTASIPGSKGSAARSRATASSNSSSSSSSSHRPFFATRSHPDSDNRDSDDAPEHKTGMISRLARLTAYWAAEGDYYTRHLVSATGIHLHGGHCAVDPSIIPYGSVVEIPGVGQFLAVDTGSAVVSRTAAREGGHTKAERGALVIDLFFSSRSEGEKFTACGAKFVSISWWTPAATENGAKIARGLFADEDWNKIYSKQL